MIFQNIRQTLDDMSNALRQDHAKFSKEPTNRISLCRSGLYKPLPCAMHRQNSLLLYRLDRHKAHVGPSNGFTDRFCVSYIVFVRLHVGLHKLRSH